MTQRAEESVWAEEQFGRVDLGDARRTARLVRMGSCAARSPAGRITAVFDNEADRQGTYDFLESSHVEAAALERGVGEAAALRCGREGRIFVAVDGSSLAFADRTGERGLGAVGTYTAGARGLKVISALAMSDTGVPIALLRQVTWARPIERPAEQRAARNRPVEEKETRYWLQAVKDAGARMDAVGAETRLTYVIDREGDSAAILTALARTGHGFIVRGQWDREVQADNGRRQKIRDLFPCRRVLGSYDLTLAAHPGRRARTAHIQLAAAEVTLSLKDPTSGKRVAMKLTAVRAREVGTAPEGEAPVDWLLLTSLPARTEEQAHAVVTGYTFRWRIEEFHRAWKSGHCKVEESQLQSIEAIEKWALVLATVAVRIERIKLISRAHPDAPATDAFSDSEIRAIILLKRRSTRKKIPDGVPTMKVATTWLAELGGYTGKSSGGPPGTVTLGRGLVRVRAAADAIEAMWTDGEMR